MLKLKTDKVDPAMPRCIGEHEGENYPIKEIFGEPFNFIVLNIKDKTSIGGMKVGK